jgi:nucleoside-diphosphate-sugar epimerase
MTVDPMSISRARHVLVTGATGHVGARLLRRLEGAGTGWTALGRTVPASSTGRHVPFRFGQPLDATAVGIACADAIIHLAASTSVEPGNVAAEVDSAETLLRLAKSLGARFVFASSQTAAANAPTGYGRMKWRLEQLVEAQGGVSARIGQVYGGPEKGLFGTLCALVRTVPVLPWFVPEAPVQPIHVDDLADALIAIAVHSGRVEKCYELGSPQPVGFAHFLAILARNRVRRRRLFVPVPRLALTLVWRLLGQSAPARLRQLESLFRMPAMPRAGAHLASLGLTLRPLEDGMARSGSMRRRTLALEASRLYRHLGGAHVPGSLVRQYVRVLERTGANGVPVDATEEQRRRLVALRVLEASPLGASLMISQRDEGLLKGATRLGISLLVDGQILIRSRLMRRRLRRST